MKVKCIKIFNEHTKKYQGVSHWLTIGKEYVVLSIDVYGDKVLYMIIDDSSDKAPGFHNMIQFEITSTKIPSNWEIIPESQGFTFGPKKWSEKGFLERCHDGENEALEIYKREAKIILEEEGAL